MLNEIKQNTIKQQGLPSTPRKFVSLQQYAHVQQNRVKHMKNYFFFALQSYRSMPGCEPLTTKLFRTSNKDIINECCSHFYFKFPSEILPVRF